MARFEFGGTTADFVFSTSELVGRRVISTTPAVLTFWNAKTGGTRYTDLLVNGAARTSVTTNADGMIPRFLGPDLVQEMWVDAGAGERMFLQITAGGAALSAATSASVAQAAKNAAEAAAATAGVDAANVVRTQVKADADRAETAADLARDISAIAVPDNVVKVLIDDEESETRAGLDKAIGTLAPPRALASATQPTPAYGVEVITATDSAVRPVDVVRGVLYGVTGPEGKTLMSSTNDSASWTHVADLPFEPRRLFATDDGEVLFVHNERLYKSSGWGTPGLTWVLKLTAFGSSAFLPFNIDGDGETFIVSQYSATNREDSRYVHISLDAGDTWTLVWDTAARFPGSHAQSHLHGVCWDRWERRFWLTEGHGIPAGYYYASVDEALAGTWGQVTGEHSHPAATPTSLVATDDGIVFGTDDAPNGILGIRRTNPVRFAIEVVWERREVRPGPYGFAEKGVRDPRTGLVYFGFRSEYPESTPYIAAGNASSGGLVWDSGVAGAFARVEQVVVTPSGRLFATYITASDERSLLSGYVGNAGAPDLNSGNTLGGTVRDGTGTATGLEAEAADLYTTATGARAKATGIQATATGALSDAGNNGTANGFKAKATGDDKATANGAEAEALATATTATGGGAKATGVTATATGANTNAGIASTSTGAGAQSENAGTATGAGAIADSVDKPTATGAGASATGALSTATGAESDASGGYSVANGAYAEASHNGSVAEGSYTQTTAPSQMHIGDRHLAGKKIMTPNEAPLPGEFRLYLRANPTTDKDEVILQLHNTFFVLGTAL